MAVKGSSRYTRLGQHEDQRENEEELGSRSSASDQYSPESPAWERKWLLGVLGICDLLALTVALIAFSYSQLHTKPLTDHELVLATNSYSPLLSRTRIELRDQRIKTALINEHNLGGESIYRQPPSPAVDDAWRKLHKGDRLFLISEEEVRKMGKDPDVVIKAPLEWGHGENKYLAVNQGQHDIHCLNNLRMFAYAEHYYGNRTARTELHALHCLHALLQTFQCKYSTDVYTAFWVEGIDAPIVEFDLTRKCQNYDNILHWNPERPYTEEQFLAVRPPPGQKRIPADVY